MAGRLFFYGFCWDYPATQSSLTNKNTSTFNNVTARISTITHSERLQAVGWWETSVELQTKEDLWTVGGLQCVSVLIRHMDLNENMMTNPVICDVFSCCSNRVAALEFISSLLCRLSIFSSSRLAGWGAPEWETVTHHNSRLYEWWWMLQWLTITHRVSIVWHDGAAPACLDV